MEDGLEIPLKTQNKSTYDQATSLLGIIQKDTMYFNIHAASFTFIILKAWQQFINDERKNNISYIYTIEYYLAIKKLKFCHLQRGWNLKVLSSVKSVRQKDKYHMILLICRI